MIATLTLENDGGSMDDLPVVAISVTEANPGPLSYDTLYSGVDATSNRLADSATGWYISVRGTNHAMTQSGRIKLTCTTAKPTLAPSRSPIASPSPSPTASPTRPMSRAPSVS